MAHMLSYFPTINYKMDGKDRIITDLSLRFRIRDLVKTNVSSYFDYTIGDGERAYMIADQYYDDPTLDWIIFLTNDILDPYYEWPLSYIEFNKYLEMKYDSVASTYQHHHYEWIVQPQRTLADGTTVSEETLTIDEATFRGLLPEEKRNVTIYQYEEGLNDAKRRIRVLDRRFLIPILAEADRILT